MRWSRALLLVALAWALAMLPVAALGLPTDPATSTTSRSASATVPVAQGPIDAQVWPAQDGQQTGVIVDVQLDPAVRLPVRVRIPIPTGAVVQWAGEIIGQDTNSDVQRDFTLHDGAGGGRYAEFTMTKSHRGQVETGGVPMTAQGGLLSTVVDFVQSVPSSSTIFTVRLAAGASQVSIDPAPAAAPDTNSAGESLYVLPTTTLATGAKMTIKISYSTSPATPVAPKAGGAPLTPVYVVLGVLLVCATAVAIYLVRRQGSGERDIEDVEPDEADSTDVEGPAERAASKETSDDPFDLDDD